MGNHILSYWQSAFITTAMMTAVACGGTAAETQTDTGDDKVDEPVGTAEQAIGATPTCVSLRKAFGNTVQDTYIASDHPTTNYSNMLTWLVGTALPGQRQALVDFDLSAIPNRALILSAKLTVKDTHNGFGVSTMNAHVITAPWTAATVTWNSFAGAYNPAVASSTSNATNPTSWDLKSTVQSWVSYGLPTATGAIPNYGLLIEETPTNYTTYTTIRASWSATTGGDAAVIPRFDICYVIQAPPAGQFVNGGATSTSTNYKAVYTIGQPTSNQGKSTSPFFQVRGGLIGATGTLP